MQCLLKNMHVDANLPILSCSCFLTLIILSCYRIIMESESEIWGFTVMWDDGGNFIKNEMIQPPFSWFKLYQMFSETRINVYEPLSWLVKAAVVRFAGGLVPSALAIRRLALILHMLNGTLLLLISNHLLCILKPFPQHRAGNKQWLGSLCSLCGAALYSVHPVHAEVVGWASAQPYTLCGAFTHLATLSYLKVYYPTSGMTQNSPAMQRTLVASATLFYVLALITKAAAVPWPAVCLAIELLIGPTISCSASHNCLRAFWQWMVQTSKRLGLNLLICIGFVLATFIANTEGLDPHADVITFSFPERVVKAQITMWMYVRLLFWPEGLRPHYTIFKEDVKIPESPEALLSCTCFVTVSAGVLLLAAASLQVPKGQGAPRIGVWPLASWGVYVAYFFPTCGLIQHGMVQKGGDRYCYLSYQPMVPILACFLFDQLSPLFPERDFPATIQPEQARLEISNETKNAEKVREKSPRTVVSFVFLVCFILVLGIPLLALSVLTDRQVQFWKNDEVLYKMSLRVEENDWRILDMYGEYLVETGRIEEARHYIERADTKTPLTTAKGFLSVSKNLVFLRKYTEACELYVEAVEHYPDSPLVFHNIAICYMIKKDFDAATASFERAIALARTKDHIAKITDNFKKFKDWQRSGFNGDYEGSIMW